MTHFKLQSIIQKCSDKNLNKDEATNLIKKNMEYLHDGLVSDVLDLVIDKGIEVREATNRLYY